MKKMLKTGVVLLAVVTLTTLTIDATDALRGSQSALSILASKATESKCPAGTVTIDVASGKLCVDAYENSPGEQCPIANPSAAVETAENMTQSACQATAVADTTPWTHVTYHQAKTLCADKGMRLPTPGEWYEAALGTPDTSACNTNSRLALAGKYDDCVSSRGVYDTIGNVWEWVEAEITNGEYAGRAMPAEGYVHEIDVTGVPVETGQQPTVLYNQDYVWSAADGVYAMMRGGYYGSGSDAGLFSVHAKVAPSFASAATGFRCVQSL